MIKESIYSKDEISITDTSKTEIIRWKRFITDHRISKDVGTNTVDLFNLDSFEVEPKYFITKTYEHGTSFKNYLHAIMNNGDEITMRSFGIRPSLERDQFQEYKIGSKIEIAGIFEIMILIVFKFFAINDYFRPYLIFLKLIPFE